MKQISLSILLTAGTAGAVSVTTDQIVNAFIQSESVSPLRATISMSVLRPGQLTRNVMEIVSDGKGRSLVTVRSPAKLAGQAFLRDGASMQMYHPAFKKVLTLPPGTQSDGFLGSDLSISDFTGGDYHANFTPGKVVQSAGSASVDLITKVDAPIPYGKLNMSVRLPGFTPQSVTFYDQRGKAVKRLSFAAFQTAQGRPFPSKLVVYDLLRPGSRTILEYTSLNFAPVPPACFTRAALGKGC
ncbi:outer membrane lipoprotein-sorting protein [Deinococcus antarcticus]|uniref:Outer membrane lipoprotein-sorting protein n=1 Tax=Deinococcus antarcticus TaxID=1298767 RepID=A0ABV8A5W8_9DEIO